MDSYQEFEELKYHLIQKLHETKSGIRLCPDCCHYYQDVLNLYKRASSIRKFSGFKRILKFVKEVSNKLSGCQLCDRFAGVLYELEREVSYRLKEEMPLHPQVVEQSISPEELELQLKRKYPFVISYAYKNLERIQESQKLDELVNVFDITLRYVCYISVADLIYRHPTLNRNGNVPLKKLSRPDLGKKGIGAVIRSIDQLIPSDNQFVFGLTGKFIEAESDYDSLYKLRCKIKHNTHLSIGLSEKAKIDLYSQHIEILKSFLKKFKILTEYHLGILENPVDYDPNSNSMIYNIILCMGNDPDFYPSPKGKIALKDLCSNYHVILIKDITSSVTDNILQLYPFIIADFDRDHHRYHLLLYHHYNANDDNFEFFGPTMVIKKIDKGSDKRLYDVLYQIISTGVLPE